jgi:2-polyprenyl-3-methyl-5-hydroxy-6-metoxy-1,4-benzoquinol methylase
MATNAWRNSFETIEDVKAEHGDWTAMSIRLQDGNYTREAKEDYRLRRLLQVAADTVNKPLSECRVLDLACLEGHYAIEFALHGAEAVAIELREANIAKAAFAADKLGLEGITFYQDDVCNLSLETHGRFDIIICSGILYHLPGPAAAQLIHTMYECCDGILLLDTFIATREDVQTEFRGASYGGTIYVEHDEGASEEEKLSDLWASVENETSFWFHLPALMGLLQSAGFTTAADVTLPTTTIWAYDRRTFLCIAGKPVEVLSSELTQAAGHAKMLIPNPKAVHASQIKRTFLFRFTKKYFPQRIKDLIKRTYLILTGRAIGGSPFSKSD